MADVALDIKDVSKSFSKQGKGADSLKQAVVNLFLPKAQGVGEHRFYALHNITFSVNKGEAVGIIGHNGAGKSTLLRVLSGISQPDSGEILFYGKTVSILEIGTGFHPELTGRENIYLAASLYNFTNIEIDANLQRIIDFSGIESFIDEPVKNYSSGMYLRLAFSIITCLSADIYLIDEVINVGDAEFQLKCRKRLEELLAEGKTLLIISHNLNDISELCSRIIMLEKGKILEQGGIEVIQKYMSVSLPQLFNFDEGLPFHIRNSAGPIYNFSDVKLHSINLEGYRMFNKSISNIEPFTIVLDAELDTDAKLDIGLQFQTAGGLLLFLTGNKGQPSLAVSGKGRFVLKFTIPAYLFNSGLYSVDFIFVNSDNTIVNPEGEHNISHGRLDKALTFRIQDETVASNSIYEGYAGILRPNIQIALSRP